MASDVVLPEGLSFGEALEELEQIVRALESGQIELEDGLARYERGVALLRACQAKLAEAKQRVTMLIGELEGDEGAPAADGDGEAAE